MNKKSYQALVTIRDMLTSVLDHTERGKLETRLAQTKRLMHDLGDRRDGDGVDHAEAEVDRLEKELEALQ